MDKTKGNEYVYSFLTISNNSRLKYIKLFKIVFTIKWSCQEFQVVCKVLSETVRVIIGGYNIPDSKPLNKIMTMYLIKFMKYKK